MDFGPILHAYTRAQALDDGVLVDLGLFARNGQQLDLLVPLWPWRHRRASPNRDVDRGGLMHSSERKTLWQLLGEIADPNFGQVPNVVYIPVGIGLGFWIPKADYALAKQRAIETGKIHFVGLVRGGGALVSSSRETLLNDPICTGEIAWIFPETWGEK